MLYIMLLAHLLGDYLFQTAAIVRWKTRSLLGVVAHGGIVTATTLTCATIVDPTWWPYALLIGVTHTLIDVVRARLVHPKKCGAELAWYLMDQIAHIAIIWLVVESSSSQRWPELASAARILASPRLLIYAIGYLLLANPTWVLLRYLVRGIWGTKAAPTLDQGTKYGPMIERALIATSILLGQFLVIPLILIPRHLRTIHLQEDSIGVMLKPVEHWAETVLSTLFAIGVGVTMRVL